MSYLCVQFDEYMYKQKYHAQILPRIVLQNTQMNVWVAFYNQKIIYPMLEEKEKEKNERKK